eukprot:Awhi_evm1s7649
MLRFDSIQESAIAKNVDKNGSSFSKSCQQLFASDRYFFEKVKLEVRSNLKNDLFARFIVDLTNAYSHIGKQTKRAYSLDTFTPLISIGNHRSKNLQSRDDYSASLASLEKLQMYDTHDSLDLLPNLKYINQSNSTEFMNHYNAIYNNIQSFKIIDIEHMHSDQIHSQNPREDPFVSNKKPKRVS